MNLQIDNTVMTDSHNPFGLLCRIACSPTPEEAMQVLCRDMLARYNIDSAPIGLRTIAQQLGVSRIATKPIAVSALRRTVNGLEIHISNREKNWRRNRWTVAHELAHIVLLSNLEDVRMIKKIHSDRELYQQYERICDKGAIEILMPEALIKFELLQKGFTGLAIRQLYDTFLVSYRTLLFRIAECIPSSAIVLWKYDDTSGEMTVLTCYQDYSRYSNAPWIPKGCTMKHVEPKFQLDSIESTASLYCSDVEFRYGNRNVECEGLWTKLPPIRGRKQLPIFDDMVVSDESNGFDAITLVFPKHIDLIPDLWNHLKRISV